MSKKSNSSKGLQAGEMKQIFENAKVLTDQLEGAKSERAKATLIGNFLSQHAGREIPIQHRRRTGLARLCVDVNKSRKTKRYYFEVKFDDDTVEGETARTNTLDLGDVDDDNSDDDSTGDEESVAPVEIPDDPKKDRSCKSGRKSKATSAKVRGNDEQW